MKFSAWFSILVGILMIVQWGFFLAAGAVPELKVEPIRLAFHLAAEFATAVLLIIAGTSLVRGKSLASNLSLVAAGMLTYTIIVSPGYFAQLGYWTFVAMFFILLVFNMFNIAVLMRNLKHPIKR